MLAEDRCRAEHVPRLARKLRNDLSRAPTWSEVFVAAAGDTAYWDREVWKPASGFVARGKRPAPSTKVVHQGAEARAAEPPAKKAKAAKKRDRQSRNEQKNQHPRKDHKG